MKSAQTSKIGKKFKAAREELGLSQMDAASETLINIDFICAIESGDYSAFPARMFALRYFEKYATFLKLRQPFFDIYDANVFSDDLQLKPSYLIIDIISSSRYIFFTILFFILFFFGIASNKLYNSFVSSPAENPDLLEDTLINQFAKISEVDNNSIKAAFQEINLLEHPRINAQEWETVSEFNVESGKLKTLSLSFTEESWLEIYQGTNKLIYRLFKIDERLEISMTPPFKIIVGNANGVSGFYGESKINFTKVANELNVSFIEIDNE
jgi:cytoskeletal protein RodZ